MPKPSHQNDRLSANRKRGDVFIARNVRLVYEDDHVIVVDKPVGLVTADPSRAMGAARTARPSAREGDTLFDAIKKHVRSGPSKGRTRGRGRNREEAARERTGRVWVIHRLDKEASGLLVFAKSELGFEKLKDQFRSKDAHRIYYAVVEGRLGEPGLTATHQSMIEEDRGPGSKRGGDKDSGQKLAITHYRVQAVGDERTLVQVRLETGRKNQIRIHMQELGHPLIGDRRFGATGDPIGRLALHAAELGFEHPSTGEQLRFESSPPPAFFRAVGQRPQIAPNAPQEAQESEPIERADRSGPATEPASKTSWNEVAGWYDTLLEDRGSDHYEQVILPGTIRLLGDVKGKRILDVACGQGVLCRRLDTLGAKVAGVDAAPKLIAAARERSPSIDYHVADARDLSALRLSGFDAATCIMALTNIEPMEPAFESIAKALKSGGRLVAVITHPAFRVPGESDWGWDDKRKRQFRRVDAYLTPFAKQIQMHPGKAAHGKPEGRITTPTFHRPVGEYVRALSASGLRLVDFCEWTSKRAATSGPRAPEENRARLEFPLFAAIVAEKL